MKNVSNRLPLIFALFSVVLISTGCGGAKNVPVTGKLTVDGAPMEGVTLSFFPDGGGVTASATTDAQGAFTVKTSDQDGCPPGTYVVTVAKYEKVGPAPKSTGLGPPVGTQELKNTLPEKYAKKDASGLTAEMKRGMAPLSFDITSK